MQTETYRAWVHDQAIGAGRNRPRPLDTAGHRHLRGAVARAQVAVDAAENCADVPFEGISFSAMVNRRTALYRASPVGLARVVDDADRSMATEFPRIPELDWPGDPRSAKSCEFIVATLREYGDIYIRLENGSCTGAEFLRRFAGGLEDLRWLGGPVDPRIVEEIAAHTLTHVTLPPHFHRVRGSMKYERALDRLWPLGLGEPAPFRARISHKLGL